MNEEKLQVILEDQIIPTLQKLIATLSELYNEDAVFPNKMELVEIMTTGNLEDSPAWKKYKDQKWAIGLCGMSGCNLIDITKGLADSLKGVLEMIEKYIDKNKIKSLFRGCTAKIE